MEERHRFSASPVNFDRFVSLQRSSSRSLSPDRELHQMLRPYQLHTTHNSSSTAGAVGTKKHRKAERRSTDMVDATASSGVLTVDGVTTQAATPPSRSASGGAASTSTATSRELSHHPASAHAAPQYYVVEEEAVDFDRSSSGVNEEVDLLLRAAQQLGGPLYNPVTQQFVCWKLHVLERRSRASYGDIEGVSCDFCGHTDWLDSVQEEEDEKEGERAMPSSRTGKLKGVKQETKQEEQEDSTGVHHLSAVPAHSRYLYHCPMCAVDICRACLAEVQADERFHVPCLQCQRCGTFETRPNAPVHQCRPKHAKVETPGDAKAARSWLPSPAPAPPEAVAPLAAPKPQPPRIFGGSTVRNLVRLGLSRSSAGGGALHAATRSAPEEPTQVLSVEPPYTPITSPDALSRAALRKRSSTLRGGGDGIVARAKAEEKEEGVSKEAAPQRRWQGAMPFRVSQARSDGDALQSPSPHAPIPSTARYEVHLRPQCTEDVDEVHRIAREQHLQLLPPPAAAKTSVAYFPTRLAAESCVDRAAAGSIEALLKRYIRDA